LGSLSSVAGGEGLVQLGTGIAIREGVISLVQALEHVNGGLVALLGACLVLREKAVVGSLDLGRGRCRREFEEFIGVAGLGHIVMFA
jgi:hypothetical protein